MVCTTDPMCWQLTDLLDAWYGRLRTIPAKGLVNSRVGIVLVTPAMLRRLPAEGVADKELSALLRRERLVPVLHGTTYEELEKVSLLLASRAGLSTSEESMAAVGTKIADLVAA